MKTIDIAASFVGLTLKYDWSKVKELLEDEVRVLLETVSAAGFEPQSIILGRLVGHFCDQDGSRTGETYPINSTCPYKVVGQEGKDNYLATEWLELAWCDARKGRDRQQLIESIRQAIERSVPLKPVSLTPEDDLLEEYPPSGAYYANHTRDDQNLGSCVGIHAFCRGWMDRRRATKTHDALVCRRCYLRVLFPNVIKTYGELRQALASKSTQVPA